MERTLSIPDGLASDVNGFAAANDVEVDRAYELLVAVGLETLDGADVAVDVEDSHLVLECPACAAAFEAPGDALDHQCGGD